jgi:hypothetical protein
MPWELQALPSDDRGSLGTVEHVQAKLRAVLPEIELFRDASGSEKLASMESQGIEVPDVIREHWLRSKGTHQALIEGAGFTIEFHLGDDEAAVVAVAINVRGSGDPMPVLRQLMKIEGWKVVDLHGQPLTAESWQSFGSWRDDAIEESNDEDEGG